MTKSYDVKKGEKSCTYYDKVLRCKERRVKAVLTVTKSYDVKKGEKSCTYYAPMVGREGDDHGVRGPRGEHSQGIQHQEWTGRVQDGGC